MSTQENADTVLALVGRALECMPFHEDLEHGSQNRRNWMAVQEKLRQTKAVLKLMGGKADGQ